MNEELADFLRKAVSGDNNSIQAILHSFKERKLSSEEQEQVHIYIKQAARTSHHAIYLRAMLYDYGYGVRQSSDMAFILMREAAAKGNASATYEIGHRYLEGIGVERNYDNALQWLKLAAGSPYYVADAMHDLGVMYERGLGVAVDGGVAETWHQKAAQKGRSR